MFKLEDLLKQQKTILNSEQIDIQKLNKINQAIYKIRQEQEQAKRQQQEQRREQKINNNIINYLER